MNQNTSFHFLQTAPGRTAIIKGKEYLYFSGYHYLGMHALPEYQELVKEGIDKYGLIFPSSRISNTRLLLYEQFETLLSELTGTEASVCVSSGFAAGQLAVSLFNTIYYLPHTHPALKQEGINAQEIHSAQQLQALFHKNTQLPFTVACDAVNPFIPSIQSFQFIEPIAASANIIVDDSHGIGLIGNGKGISALLPASHQVNYICSYSLSKAFGLPGGAISGTKSFIEKYKQKPAYTAATAIAPAQVFAFMNAAHLHERQRETLNKLIAYFITLIEPLKEIQYVAGLPFFVLPDEVDEEKLFSKNIIISSFAYPTPQNPKKKRIILNALHTTNDLDYLAAALKEIWNEANETAFKKRLI
jgi:7-keto-8-aminopelargonate synthetase-like enzyme